tara:strand:- start:52 stop:1020 length:969 start_codon:yes stop_codon:yes gene_type:complete
MKFLLTLFTFIFVVSCALQKTNEVSTKNKSVATSENQSILLDENVIKDSSFIIDKYPIKGVVENLVNQKDYETPRPKQLFSAASSNEIRLHKLGEIRWIYLGLEPSAAWPMTIEFLKGDENFGLDSFDPNTGTINSKIFKLNNIDSKYVFKIERGLQQSSSEIFISQLKKIDNSWQIISIKESQLDNLITKFYEYLSTSSPTTGTSLVALNLNASNKTEVIKDTSGMSKIKLRINYARAWAALRRSLLLAGYKILDEDRNEGKFYLEYFLRRSLLDRRPDITNIEIIVEELNSKECLISTNLDEENLDLSEEIISQINQSLS